MNLQPAPHEGDIRFTCGVHPDPDTPDRGLGAYYACDSLIKEWGDRWETEGKPTDRTQFNGHEWALAFDYSESGLDPWESDEYQLETVREYRFYFVATDSPHYSGEPADRDDRVHGGTITVRPRWPGLTSDGEPVSVPQYGAPYIDVQVQASNIPHRDYHDLAKRVFDAFGISARYLDNPHPDSHVNDLAYYVRPERGESGPLYAPDGPIARAHNLIQGDRSGYRKHEENHTKIPGFKVSAILEDSKADTLIRGHSLGKELKHYYPKHPDKFEPNEAPHHPKFEVSYQTKRTEGTVRWGEAVKSNDVSFQDARRELQETLLNSLDWAGIAPTADAGIWVDHDPYWQVQNTHESRKLVPDPLPDIEDEQEHRVMKLWGEMKPSDRDVTELLLSDGGKVSPQEAAERTGNSYRTVREVTKRLQGLIKHTYGEMEIESKKMQQELLKRVRAAGERFEGELGSAAMDLADAADDRVRTAWDRARRRYAVTVQKDGDKDCQELLNVGYKAQDKSEADEIVSKLKARYRDGNGLFGVDLVIETLSDGLVRYNNLENWERGNRKGDYMRRSIAAERAQEVFDFEAWQAAGCPPADEWNND